MPRVQRQRPICKKCILPLAHCICAEVSQIDASVPLTLVIHDKEFRKCSNTGLLAPLGLRNADVIVRGRVGDDPIDYASIIPSSEHAFFLFPHPNSVDISEALKTTHPSRLLFADGNWNQARRIFRRLRELPNVTCVILPKENFDPASAAMRKEPREKPEGMLTIEAMIATYAALGDQLTALHLDQIFRKKQRVHLGLKGMGHLLT